MLIILLTGKIKLLKLHFMKNIFSNQSQMHIIFLVLQSTFYHFHSPVVIFRFSLGLDFTLWICVSKLLIVFLYPSLIYIISVYVPYCMYFIVRSSIYCMIFIEISPTECSYPVSWRIDRKTENSWWKTGKGRSNSFYARRVISLLGAVYCLNF